MIYYILNVRQRTFEVKHSARQVAIFLLGKTIDGVLIFKHDGTETKSYLPTIGDVTLIEKELESL